MQSFIIKKDVSCILPRCPNQVEEASPSILCLLRVVIVGFQIRNGCLILSNAFSVSTDLIKWFSLFHFADVVNYTGLFFNVYQLCIPGINYTWPWYVILSVYC